ncbi:MAG: type II secretion system protein [Verrucomicrobiota bacterium]
MKAHDSSGFSLTEILVVITVIGILLAISVPLAGKAIQRSNQMECANILRTIYQGIELYATDNGGNYPGPSWSNFSAGYRTGDTTHLSSHLAPYLGYTETNQWKRMDELVSKAHSKAAGLTETDVNPALYRINSTDYSTNFKRPFGYSGSWWSATSDDLNPKRTVRLSNPASEWMLRNIDIGGEAVHGKIRNYLYFDGHVEAQPLAYLPTVN